MAKPIKEVEIDQVSGATLPMPAASPTPMDLLRQAMDSGASLDVIERMMTFQERWEANQARKAFDAAMAEAAKEFPVISKSAEVDFTSSRGRTHYKHADLAQIIRTVAPILGKHGLSHRFETHAEVGQPVIVACRITHKDGHFITNSLPGPRDDSGNKNAIQSMGSTITYLSRYTLMAVLGLAADEDDDGRASAPPTIKPDVMKGRSGETPTRSQADGPEVSDTGYPGGASVREGTVGPDPVPGKLTIPQIQALEAAAREAAAKGSADFRTFWLNHNSVQERNVIVGLGSELSKLRDEADAAMMKDTKHDPETGEIRD